jgi:hypothetical protein
MCKTDLISLGHVSEVKRKSRLQYKRFKSSNVGGARKIVPVAPSREVMETIAPPPCTLHHGPDLL